MNYLPYHISFYAKISTCCMVDLCWGKMIAVYGTNFTSNFIDQRGGGVTREVPIKALQPPSLSQAGRRERGVRWASAAVTHTLAQRSTTQVFYSVLEQGVRALFLSLSPSSTHLASPAGTTTTTFIPPSSAQSKIFLRVFSWSRKHGGNFLRK